MNPSGPPQTPRNHRHRLGMVLLTPQLQFGLSFLPSFALSPLPTTLTNLFARASTPPKLLLLDTLATRKRPLLTGLTPHMDTLAGDDDLWTAVDSNTMLTSLSSIYEEPTQKRSRQSTSDWTADLDAVLQKCHHQLTRFRQQRQLGLSVLMSTPQPHILSRMLFSKTGVNKLALDVALRLQYLNRTSAPNSELARVPLHDPVNTAEAIDHELSQLLQLPSPAPASFEIEVGQFELSYHRHPYLAPHQFSFISMPPVLGAPSSVVASTLGQCVPAIDLVNHTLWPHHPHVPVIVAEHSLNLQVPRQPTEALDLILGTFKLYLRLVATGDSSQSPLRLLSWQCKLVVWNNITNTQIYEGSDYVNGYPLLTAPAATRQAYDVQIAFLKPLLSGYLNFVIEGGSECNLTVVQVLFDGARSADQPYAVMIHRLRSAGDAKPGTQVSVTQLTAPVHHQFAVPEEDDNETVLADSLPCKLSPHRDYGASPMPRKRANLTIDLDRAGFILGHQGPMTAPVYNDYRDISLAGGVPHPLPHQQVVMPHADEFHHQFMQAHRHSDQRIGDFDAFGGPMVPPMDALENKENKVEITFGPMIEYDPSKNPDALANSAKLKQPTAGQHRFPVNTPVTMYKPKK